MSVCVLPDAELNRLLAEDCPFGDLTTLSLGIGDHDAAMTFRARDAMTVAGIEEAARIVALCGATASATVRSGDRVEAGAILLTASGTAGQLHAGVKVAQTFTEIWSGVASAARRLVDAAETARPGVKVACTRKNVPGTRAMAVKAIRCGGAIPHRIGLSETILVFAEHRLFLDEDWAATGRRLREASPEKKLVIEVADVDEAVRAASAGFDVIQMERFSPDMVAECAARLARMQPRPLIAATAGINPDNATRYVQAGADLLVSSWPYTAGPKDVKVEFARR